MSNSNKLISYIIIIVLLLISLFTLFIQNKNVGFGINIHGWVSSHVLAIINRANYENNFVGYTTQFKNSNNEVEYWYFDRYPVFFSASSNLILSKWNDSIPAKIYYARQMMNIYFILTLILSYLLLAKITENKLTSLGANTICVFQLSPALL